MTPTFASRPKLWLNDQEGSTSVTSESRRPCPEVDGASSRDGWALDPRHIAASRRGHGPLKDVARVGQVLARVSPIDARSESVGKGRAPRIIGDLPDDDLHVDRNDMDELEHRSGTVSRVNVDPNVYGPRA